MARCWASRERLGISTSGASTLFSASSSKKRLMSSSSSGGGASDDVRRFLYARSASASSSSYSSGTSLISGTVMVVSARPLSDVVVEVLLLREWPFCRGSFSSVAGSMAMASSSCDGGST